jgi:hypothetical protein
MCCVMDASKILTFITFGQGTKVLLTCRLTRNGNPVACEVSMADLHQTRNPNPNAGIDAGGWLFAATAAIAAIAGVIAYKASGRS